MEAKQQSIFKVGDEIYFAHQTEAESHRVIEIEVGWAGDFMLTISGMGGQFNQTLFKKKISTCFECGKQDDTVYERACCYDEEVRRETKLEMVCDACEEQHALEI